MALNAEKFFELMNTLPDDMLVSAVRSEPKRNRKPMYIVSAIAACLVVGVTAVIYPKLRVQPPEIREPDVTVTETTTVSSTTETETSVTMPSAVSLTGSVSESITPAVSSSAETTQTASTAQTAVTGDSSAVSNSAQVLSRTTEFTKTQAGSKTEITTPEITRTVSRTEATTAVSVTESALPTTTAEAGDTTTAANAMQTDTIVDDSGTKTETTTRTETEMPLDFWILKQEVMEKEPKHRIREWNLYREALPDTFAYDTVPDIDFSKYDCLIVRFSAYTYSDDPAPGYYPISPNYRIKIFPVYDTPVGTVVEYVIAFPIPKSLYADTIPEGLWDIQMGDGISGNTEMICKLIYWNYCINLVHFHSSS